MSSGARALVDLDTEPSPQRDLSMEDDTHDTSAATLEALEALPVIIESLALPGGEFNRSLHEQHIELSRLAGMEDQEEVAKLGLVKSLACGEGAF